MVAWLQKNSFWNVALVSMTGKDTSGHDDQISLWFSYGSWLSGASMASCYRVTEEYMKRRSFVGMETITVETVMSLLNVSRSLLQWHQIGSVSHFPHFSRHNSSNKLVKIVDAQSRHGKFQTWRCGHQKNQQKACFIKQLFCDSCSVFQMI